MPTSAFRLLYDKAAVNFMLKMLQGVYLCILRQAFLVRNCILFYPYVLVGAALNVSIYCDSPLECFLFGSFLIYCLFKSLFL